MENLAKDKLELKIMKTAKELFSLQEPKPDYTCGIKLLDHSAEWKNLYTNLADSIWNYAGMLFGKESIKSCGVEIMKCIQLCVHNYDFNTEKPFINYLSASLKKMISSVKVQQNIENHRKNIKVPEKKERKIQTLLKTAGNLGKNLQSQEVQKWLSQQTGYSIEEINHLVAIHFQYSTISENKVVEGEAFSHFETKFVSEQSRYKTPEQEAIMNFEISNNKSKLDMFLIRCQQEWAKLKDAKKEYVSVLLTRQLFEEVKKISEITNADMEQVIKKYSFINTELSQCLFSNSQLPSQQDIAVRFCKNKTDASRTMKNFLEKVTKKMST